MALVLAASSSTAWAQSHSYAIDLAGSRIVVHVGKTGLLGFAGHEHEIRAPFCAGTLVVDLARVEASSADLRFDARTLRVVDQGEPPKDVPVAGVVKVNDAVRIELTLVARCPH